MFRTIKSAAPAIVILLILLFYISIFRTHLKRFDGNYSGFLHVKSRFLARNPFIKHKQDLKERLIVSKRGHDTVFYYAVAFDPFLSKFKAIPKRYSRVVDSPRVRFARIGYPMLIRVFSGNDPAQFPKTMVFLLLASHLIGSFFLVKILCFYGQSPWWALLYVLIPGFVLSSVRVLPEPISAAFLLGGLYFYLRDRIWISAVFFAASILVRESAAIFIVLVVVFELFVNNRKQNGIIVVCSLLPFLLWKLFLTWRLFPEYGWSTLVFSPQVLTYPFGGIAELITRINSGKYPAGISGSAIFYMSLLVLLTLYSLSIFLKKRDLLSSAVLAYSVLFLSLNYEKVWTGLGNVERTTSEVFLLSILSIGYLYNGNHRIPKAVFALLFGMILVYDLFFLTVHTSFQSGLFLKGFF